LAVAADTATFAEPELHLGIIPCFGGTQRLPRLIGRKRALEIILTGEPISAAQARDCGLINHVTDAASVLDVAFEMARRATRGAPIAVKTALAAVTRGLNVSIGEGLEIEAAQFAINVPTKDTREGLDAFLERRPAELRRALKW